jgi:DNA mismatch repair protein MutS2
VATFETQAQEILAEIRDRADRLKLEREAQKKAAILKREAARTGSAAREGVSQDARIQGSRSVKVLRNGQPVGKPGKASDQSAEERHADYALAEPREIVVGDRVRLRALGLIGIVEQIKGDQAEVRAKSLHFRERLNQLELVEAIQPAKTSAIGGEAKASSKVQSNVTEEDVPSELNVIGRTTDEAIDAVDKFLDRASLANLSQVRIVHGHGTGALRRAIGGLLKDHPHVERFSPAPPDRGGAGATIVQLQP